MNKLLAVFIGFGAGGIVVSLLNTLLTAIFARDLFKDGQYAMLYFFWVPQGAWLGAFTGYGLAASRTSNRVFVGIALIVASLLFAVPAILFSFGDSNGAWDRLIGFFGLALVWALALIIWGIVLMKPSPNT